MCVVLYRVGGWGVMQGKALASAVVVHFPPERSSLSLHQPTFSPAFLSGGSLQVTVTRYNLKQQSKRERRKVGLPLLPSSPPLPRSSLHFFLSFPQRIGGRGSGGGGVRTVLGAHVIGLGRVKRTDSMCSPTLLHYYYLCKNSAHYRRL